MGIAEIVQGDRGRAIDEDEDDDEEEDDDDDDEETGSCSGLSPIERDLCISRRTGETFSSISSIFSIAED